MLLFVAGSEHHGLHLVRGDPPRGSSHLGIALRAVRSL